MRKKLSIVIVFCLTLVMLAGCGGTGIKLLPEDASLFFADDIVVEPDKAPYNLGNWLDGNIASWTVEIPEDGMYRIEIEYSRPSGYGSAPGGINIFADDDNYDLSFTADETGKAGDEDDWSVYKVIDIGSATLKSGTIVFEVYPDYSEYLGFDYFINLRSITLVKE